MWSQFILTDVDLNGHIWGSGRNFPLWGSSGIGGVFTTINHLALTADARFLTSLSLSLQEVSLMHAMKLKIARTMAILAVLKNICFQ